MMMKLLEMCCSPFDCLYYNHGRRRFFSPRFEDLLSIQREHQNFLNRRFRARALQWRSESPSDMLLPFTHPEDVISVSFSLGPHLLATPPTSPISARK